MKVNDSVLSLVRKGYELAKQAELPTGDFEILDEFHQELIIESPKSISDDDYDDAPPLLLAQYHFTLKEEEMEAEEATQKKWETGNTE